MSKDFARADIESTITARFSRVVARQPQAVALTQGRQRVTYLELERRANYLAGAIVEATPGRPGCIAMLLDHSIELVIAALAVLKAGKIQLALHPRLPRHGIKSIVEDAAPQLVITAERYRDRVEGQTPLCLEEAAGQSASAPAPSELTPDSPCAVLYTSGTTAKPKGVVKSHRSVLHRVWLGAVHDKIQSEDRASLMTHLGFASAEADTFATLLMGGRVCLFDVLEEGLQALAPWLNREQITLFHPPVVLFREFLNTLSDDQHFPSVRLLALAGEVVRADDLRKWRRHSHPSCEIRHRFSSTETALISVAHWREPPAEIDCGKPVQDKFIELWDAQERPVKPGEVGRLVVKSRFLADGYWNDPRESARVFRNLGTEGRLFLSQDLGRLLPDGSFQFLGRQDSQVKVRGFRVSTREVEEVLLGLPQVAQAAVEGENGQLSAWVVLKDPSHSLASVQAELRDVLPDWKIPTRMALRAELPRTLTGKVDRPQLKNSPNEFERRLREIWLSLGHGPVEMEEDLTLKGCDSVTVVSLLYEVEQAFSVQITPQEFFRHRSLAHLARLLGERTQAREEPRVRAAPEVPIVGPDHLSDAFLRLLVELGVDCLFINPGTDSVPILESMVKLQALGEALPRLVPCLHESVALAAAHGFFMVSGKPQVVFVHVDVGTQNLGANLHNAQRGRAGVVIMAGRSPLTLQGSPAARDRYVHWIQEQLHQANIVADYVKWYYDISAPENLTLALQRALELAGGKTPGPVYLTLPREVLMQPLTSAPELNRKTRHAIPSVAHDCLDQAVQWVLEAKNPLLLTSRLGSRPESVAKLVEFAETLAVAVVENRQRVNFPVSHPLHLGFSPYKYLQQSDLVIVVDHEVPWLPSQWSPGDDCKVIYIDSDVQKCNSGLWGFPVDLALQGDSGAILEAISRRAQSLSANVTGRQRAERLQAARAEHQMLRQSWRARALSSRAQSPMSSALVAHTLNQFVDSQTLFVCDAATNNPHIWRHLELDQPGTFYQSQGSGLGWGLGAALGAKLALPEKEVLCIIGDGSWMFANPLAVYHAGETQQAPFLTVLLNNQCYAAIKDAIHLLYPGGHSRRLAQYPACQLPLFGYYCDVAKAAGLWSRAVTDEEQLRAALGEGLATVRNGQRCALVEVQVAAEDPD